jgi:hypothetical protein
LLSFGRAAQRFVKWYLQEATHFVTGYLQEATHFVTGYLQEATVHMPCHCHCDAAPNLDLILSLYCLSLRVARGCGAVTQQKSADKKINKSQKIAHLFSSETLFLKSIAVWLKCY